MVSDECFLWDLLVKDADDSVIRTKVSELNKASGNPGSIYGHNEETIELNAVTPDLKSLGSRYWSSSYKKSYFRWGRFPNSLVWRSRRCKQVICG